LGLFCTYKKVFSVLRKRRTIKAGFFVLPTESSKHRTHTISNENSQTHIRGVVDTAVSIDTESGGNVVQHTIWVYPRCRQ